MSAGWRLGQVASEALADLLGGSVRAVLLFMMLAGGFAVVVGAELEVSGQLRAQADNLRARGGDVAIVTAEEAPIEAATCEALGRRPHVVAAGSSRGIGTVGFASAPGQTFELIEVTPGALAVWDPAAHLPRGGWLVGPAAADELGVRTGSLLAEPGQQPQPVTVVEVAARNQFADRAILALVAAAGEVDGCWVEFRAAAASGGRTALPAAFAGVEVSVRPLVRLDEEFARDPRVDFERRPQRHLWVPVGALMTALLALGAFGRRSDMAVYRAFGLPRAGVLAFHQTQVLVLAVAAFAAAVPWALAAYAALEGLPSPDQVVLATRTSARALLLIVAVAPWLAALAGRGSPAALLKER
ncbi:MAG: hypothetical protein ACNA8R_13335 [Nitriliruptoraceae bacterium]|jgi:hypothetical protein